MTGNRLDQGGFSAYGRPAKGAKCALRLVVMFVALITGLVLITGRLFWVQVLASDRFVLLAKDQRERKVSLPPQRGSILDSEGAELAMSMEMRTIYANPGFVVDPQAAADAIAPIISGNPVDLKRKLASKSGFVYLARKVEPGVAYRVKALGLPGVDVIAESKRFYPAGPLASHLVGFVGFNNQGLGGLESRHDDILKGTPGEILTERDPQGRPIPAGESFVRRSIPGDDLVLTVDRQIQFAAEAALAKAIKTWSAKGGTVVAMDPKSGEILALANLPTFDPNNFKESQPEARKNRAVQDVFEPGSANKVITAAAAIESGVVAPTDSIRVPDTIRIGTEVLHDSHRHPTENLSFSEVIQQSSNTGTIKVALNLGKEPLYRFLVQFGYGRRTALNFPGESAGILPKPDKWWGTSVGTIPIGQGVAVTSLQVMEVFSTLANNGVAVEPKLLKAVIDSNGRRHETKPSASRRVVKQDTARKVTEMLVGVTQGEKGTGHSAAIPGFQVAGKTGTAQKPRPDGRGYSGYIASFIGYAPAYDPKVVVGVFLDDPQPIYGGSTSAVTFKEIMQFSLRHLGIGPGPVLPPEGTPLPAPARSGGVAPA